MFKNGARQQILLDNYIPTQAGAPVFSKAKGNELWVILMEKAWAKIHGNYQRIENGDCGACLRDLTGAPFVNLDLEDPEVEKGILEKLIKYDQLNYVMCASLCDMKKGSGVNSMGLVNMHAYSLISVIPI